MQHFHMRLVTMVVGSLVTGVAFAAPTPIDVACHAAYGKQISKYQGTVAKRMVGCHKARSGAKIDATTNCNDVATADSSPAGGKGTRATTRAAISTAISQACAGVSASFFDGYAQCPSPATGNVNSIADLTTCLLDLTELAIGELGKTALGDATTALDENLDPKAVAKCQGSVGKGITKVLKTVAKARVKCQLDAEGSGAELDYAACALATTKAPEALAKLDESLVKSCTSSPASIAQIRACGDSAAKLSDCVTGGALPDTAEGLAAAIFELTGNCPGSMDLLVHAGTGSAASYDPSPTRADLGYSGHFHNERMPDGWPLHFEMQGCDSKCANCQVRLSAQHDGCRCLNDSTIPCDELPTAAGEQASPECGGNVCRCNVAPPHPVNGSLVPLCLVHSFSHELTGGTTTVGSHSIGTRLRSVLYAGISQVRPCPTCVGDAVANDGIPGGQCKYADEDPLTGSCDANGTDADFGAVSYDCMPQGSAVGSTLSAFDLTTGTSAVTANAALPCFAGSCHCGACTGNNTIACDDDADCSAVAAGTCGVDFGVDNPRQNTCSTGTAECVPDADHPGMGVCSSTFEKFCDQAIRANGDGLLTCTSDASCDAYDPICENDDCGSCVAGLPNENRSCFLASVSASGKPGWLGGESIAVTCMGRTASGVLNTALGLPGPMRLRLEHDTTLYCDDDVTPFQAPGGSTCP